MIISCTKCNKKFEVTDNLIPSTGRKLQCGSCSHQWLYIPIQEVDDAKEKLIQPIDNNIKTIDEAEQIIEQPEDNNIETTDEVKQRLKQPKDNNIKTIEEKIKEIEPFINNKSEKEPLEKNINLVKKKKLGFLNFLLVLIITFAALGIIIDTFRNELLILIPDLDHYIYSFYEVLKDIFLFFSDLINFND